MDRQNEPKVRSNDLVLVGSILAVTAIVVLIIVSRSSRDPALPETAEAESASVLVEADRSIAPAIDGRVLPVVDQASRAPAPSQWGGDSAGVPFAQWWSSAVVGPGSHTLWSYPLAVRIDPAGRVDIAAPVSEVGDDGTSSSRFIPTVTMLGPETDAVVEVVDSGAFHVTIEVGAAESSRRLDLVQGGPFVELTLDGSSEWFVPGLNVTSSTANVVEFETAEGPWLLASNGPIRVTGRGDTLAIDADETRHLVIGPRLASADAAADRWSEIAVATAAAPLETTTEETIVGPDGSVIQELAVVREGGADSVFVLLAHQLDAAGQAPSGEPLELDDRTRTATLTSQLDIQFPSVPLAWDLLDPTSCAGCDDVGGASGGSYFAGKEALRLAQLAQLSVASGDDGSAQAFLDSLELLLTDLVSPGGQLQLTWDPNWGSVILLPGEFGLGDELNDHSLQYGYWIAAASIFEQHRSGDVPGLVQAIDLLIGDMGGVSIIDGVWPGLAEQRTWSPYEGHSWASGLAPFPDGNNLESISESLNAWWATARWLYVTGRADHAGDAIARFTIESALSSQRWLPTNSPTGVRPWSGIVWGGKVDNTTWFDGRPEAALGIRLLPLTPASLARYGTTDEVDAAARRWSWCDEHGGCGAMWSNLLDSDAVVAGLPELVSGPEPEASTSASVSSWWRTLIETRGVPSPAWSCSAGIVAFDVAGQPSIALGTSPSGVDATGVCRHNTTGTIASLAVLADGQTELELPEP